MGQARVHRLAFVSNVQKGQLTSDNLLDFLKTSHENLKTEHREVWDSELPEGVLSCWMGLNGSWSDTVWIQGLFNLHNIPKITRTSSQKNQLIQNVGARLLTGIISCSHLPAWLLFIGCPLNLESTLLLLTHKILWGQAPPYLGKLIAQYQPKRLLSKCWFTSGSLKLKWVVEPIVISPLLCDQLLA